MGQIQRIVDPFTVKKYYVVRWMGELTPPNQENSKILKKI